MANSESNESAENETGKVANGRQNRGGRNGKAQRKEKESEERAAAVEKEAVESAENETEETASFPIELQYPEAEDPSWKDYMGALDAFQGAIIHGDEVNLHHLRIVSATVPLDSAPETYVGAHAGFPVIKGNEFSVKLNNGTVVTA